MFTNSQYLPDFTFILLKGVFKTQVRGTLLIKVKAVSTKVSVFQKKHGIHLENQSPSNDFTKLISK